MDRFAREVVLEVFRRFGVRNARRAEPTDSTEEIFIVPPRTYERIDVDALTEPSWKYCHTRRYWLRHTKGDGRANPCNEALALAA
jgi:hypothetical protein